MATVERFLVWGAGGHGKVVRDVLIANGDLVVAYADAVPTGSHLTTADGKRLPLVGEDALLDAALPFGATAVALGIGDNHSRLGAFERVHGRFGTPFRAHPTAVIGSGVVLGAGSIVMPGAVINAGAVIGRGVIINTGAVVEHDVRLEDGVHVSPGAVVCGGVVIGRFSWIGAGATVVPGMQIGAGATIGAGSCVIREVPAGAVVAGCPAKALDVSSQ